MAGGKSPFLVEKIVLKSGGLIETSIGTDIVTVSNAGVPTLGSGLGTATVYNSIGDAAANGSIQFAGYTGTYTSTTANWGGLIISNTHANPTAGASLLNLDYTANGDAHGVFCDFTDNAGADSKFKVELDGKTTIAGTATGTDALTLTAGDITLTDGDLTLTTGAITLTAGGLDVDSDNVNITLGDSGATDSYIVFDGTNLKFYDSAEGTARTLSELYSNIGTDPTLVGNVTISDGQFDWTSGDDEQGGAWTFSNTTGNDITWVSAATTGNCLSITADPLTSGSMLYLDTLAAGFTGEYIRCYDGAADDFVVAGNGATTIAGSAGGTDALTITAGDLFMSDSDQNIIESEDGTTTTMLIDNKAGVVADNNAVLTLDAGGAIASGSNILRVAPTGTPNAGAIGIEFVGAGKLLTALSIDADPTASDVVEINGGGALTNGLAVLAITNDGNLAAGGCDQLITMGGTPNADARALEIDAQKDARAIYIDTDAVTNHAIEVTHSGNLASTKSVLFLTDAGTPADATPAVIHAQFTGTTANQPIAFLDGGGKDVIGLKVDSDTSTQSATSGQVLLYNNNAGALGGSVTIHTDSASPAADDQLFNLSVYGEDDASNAQLYGQITVEALVVGTGAEEGQIKMGVDDGGTIRESFWLTDDTLALGDSAAFVLGSNGAQDLTISTAIDTAGVNANEPKIVMTDGASGDITVTAGGTDGEIVLASPVVHSSTQSLTSANEAINLTTSIGEFVTDGDGTTHTFADGVEGQIKFLVLITDGGGNAVVTPTNFGQGSTLTFADVGDACSLLFTNGQWYITGNQGVAVA